MAEKHFSFRFSRPSHLKQGGMALIMLVFVLALASISLWTKRLNGTDARIQRAGITSTALANGKAALIAYALSNESNTSLMLPRPGDFPCPDTDGDGSEQPTCSSTNLGMLPWKTLGIPQDSVKDGSGEVLWYSVSSRFRHYNISSTRITSDTKGTLIVYSDDGTTTLTPAGSEGVAVLIAPGSPINNQTRDNSTAANYLESKSGRNNATPGGPFIAGTETTSFNDQLLVIRTRDFMPMIESRVARELKIILQNYYLANGVYPYPAKYDSCGSTCDSDTDVCRGRIPLTAEPVDWTGSYQLPQWFMTNRWYRVIPYAVGSASLDSPVAGCDDQVTVSSIQHKALFFMPGTPIGSITRPSNTMSYYLEDAENNEEWTTGDHIYTNPTSSSNDSLYTID